MPTLVLARHGRTNANSAGVLAGRTPGVRLDSLGESQVAAAGERLADVKVVAIATSPMQRCRQTATAIARSIPGAPNVRTAKEFAEVDYGSWTGRSLKDLVKEPQWRTVQAHPSAAQFPGGESLAQMSARVVAGVRRWNATVEEEFGPDAVWVLASHGDPIKAILADALGAHLDSFQRIVVDPGSLSVIRYTPTRPFVLGTNTTAGALTQLNPPTRKRRSRKREGDAVVGGGTGTGG